ncbi:hypothetical protein MY04_4645 [Flammeovirga sp. MY04]|uniref:hypothetical protein n=1 Tax=Flammeovirga sp. MY04 TaxID=1191459 RepID=UPI000806361F|nr:hypothetical protein [Flammeovirga sp. MY04]ANQ51980.1 hypothetical protein MY04_4645 [Flammeovirga sp. MY04]
MRKLYTSKVAYIDTRKLPLVYIKVTKEEPNIEDVAEYKKILFESFSHINQRCVVVDDASSLKWMDAVTRIQLGKVLKQFEEQYSYLIYKYHYVTPNLAIQFILEGINLVAKPKIKQAMHTKLQDAEEESSLDVRALNRVHQ